MGRKSLAPERREQILDAFYRCLAEKGLEGCSLANIAKEADLTTSLITHYFENKEELSKELIQRVLDLYEEFFFKPIETIEDPEERLEKLLGVYFNDEIPTRDYTRAYLAVVYRATRSEDVLDAMNKSYERYYGVLRDVLLEVDQSGRLTPAEAEKIAITIMALSDGLWAHWFMVPKKAHPSLGIDIVKAYLNSVLDRGQGSKKRKKT